MSQRDRQWLARTRIEDRGAVAGGLPGVHVGYGLARGLVGTQNIWFGLLATFSFAVLTAISARFAVYLPFTPVPITLQVASVILSGFVLGPLLGAASQLEYLAMGLIGAPVFAGGKAGIAALVGPTGGYLVGFVVAAFIAGLGQGGSAYRRLFCGAASIAAIYLAGSVWLTISLRGAISADGLAQSLKLGVAPFVLVDLLKLLACLAVVDVLQMRRTDRAPTPRG